MGNLVEIVLREATNDDAQLLFDWANSADAQAASLNTSAPIPWGDHITWLGERLKDAGSIIWIAQRSGHPIGSIRLVEKKRGLEVAIYVDPTERKSGFALTMLKKARVGARAKGLNGPLIARILLANSASIELFEKAGYHLLETHDDHLVLCIA